MPVKIKLRPEAPAANRRRSGLGRSLLRGLLVLLVAGALVAAGVAAYFDHKYQGVVAARLAAGPLFAPVAQIYAAPREVRTGQRFAADEIASELRRAGYNTRPELGTFQLTENSVSIRPGPQSYYSADSAATITTRNGVVQSITADTGAALRAYQLEPQLITALSEDKNRSKRRLVTYQEIPRQMVEAVTSIEDRRFFEHGGINYARTLKCGVDDLLSRHMSCGGSTLTQQLARGFFLSPEKRITRKLAEITITFQLESRFSKQQIFAMYANQINLGQRGSYAINGFGEAAQAYFGKNLRQLDLAEDALLAGMIQSPSRLNPYRHPKRATERRNVVLDSMVETGDITAAAAARAKAEPLHLAPLNVDASEAPYFVDLVHDQMMQRIGEQAMNASGGLRIYTSLDPELQSAASAAVAIGMQHVDELVRKRHHGADPVTYPQVALVALNPHTGQILALVGGRNYGSSQLDHAAAERPTGSIFKPFVYAAAYNTSLNGTAIDGSHVFTATTELNDDPTTFSYGGQSYTPGNFVRGEFPGMVTAVQAIEHSLNIATINLAQMVGFGNVAALARSAGIPNARATPSVAIGTYGATPIEMAGAYTTFANGGVHLKPWTLASVRNTNGDLVADYAPEAHQVLDPRSAYLTQSLLENVMTYGTGSAARAHGFSAPAAGKTGTSHDAWFAGYSSNLLCIVWVGNDDYTDIKLQGADAAAPLWAEFMKRAAKLPQYSDMKSFTPPDGVTTVRLDKTTNLLADATCPNDFYAAFLDGTQPQNTCSQMSQSPQSLVEKLFGDHGHPQDPFNGETPTDRLDSTPGQPPSPDQPKKRNFLQKLFGGGDKKPPQTEPEPPPQAQPPQ